MLLNLLHLGSQLDKVTLPVTKRPACRSANKEGSVKRTRDGELFVYLVLVYYKKSDNTDVYENWPTTAVVHIYFVWCWWALTFFAMFSRADDVFFFFFSTTLVEILNPL